MMKEDFGTFTIFCIVLASAAGVLMGLLTEEPILRQVYIIKGLVFLLIAIKLMEAQGRK